MSDEKIFYVYLYLDPRKPGKYQYNDLRFDYEPFYVGKGKNDRKFDHVKLIDNCKNILKTAKIKKILAAELEPIIIEYKTDLTEEESFNLETSLIDMIGTIRNINGVSNRGPLANLARGGLGGAHFVSEETRKKHSESAKKVMSNPEVRDNIRNKMLNRIPWNKGKKLTKEHRDNCSKALKGKPSAIKGKNLPDEWKRNIGLAHGKKFEKYYIFTSPFGEEYIVLRDTTNGNKNFLEFLKKNKLSIRALYDIKFNGAIRQRDLRGQDDSGKWKIRLATEDEIEKYLPVDIVIANDEEDII